MRLYIGSTVFAALAVALFWAGRKISDHYDEYAKDVLLLFSVLCGIMALVALLLAIVGIGATD